TERIGAARLLLDRLTCELRATPADASAASEFIGTSNSIQFVKADLPALVPWTGAALGRSTFPVTDLKRVNYELQFDGVTNVAGLLRTEEPLVGKRLLAAEDEDFATTNTVAGVSLPPAIEEIRFLQFRYWSGTNWLDTWNSGTMPQGIEV